MTSRRVQTAIALVFLFVGILSVANAFQFNRYVRATVVRDNAQEECQRETLIALRGWAQARVATETAYSARDDALADVVATIEEGGKATPEQTRRLLVAVQGAQTARDALFRNAREHPLPVCKID